MRPCVLIPHCNHVRQFLPLLPALERVGLPVIVVDDGSTVESFAALAAATVDRSWLQLEREVRNRGKGHAVMRGLRLAAAHGFTHAVQVDADGQHRIDEIPALLAAAAAEPTALISGAPIYDATVPGLRRHGRKVSLIWARIETCSCSIADSMCGFRVYPIAAVLAFCADREPGPGMEFDAEVLVRAHWAGLPLRFVPTAVTYPTEGFSHFRLLRDNARISAMHARLFFGMLFRLPRLLRMRLRGEG